NPPSAPTIGVEWYKQGGIMTRPTVFGMNGGRAMVGGEAGAEAILPLTQFWNTLSDYLKPQKTEQKPNVTNNIYITVEGRGDSDDTLADKVARRIVEVIDNM
ncbi:MAG: phage tail tape measure protein, partial [Oscillospiraceae bacterium]|nr:phage tail tape measure protein [Oscillospiraceae bacterium]